MLSRGDVTRESLVNFMRYSNCQIKIIWTAEPCRVLDHMNTFSVQNFKEAAAAITSEFTATLENIPSEVQFLLRQLRSKETQSQELQQEIAKDGHTFICHALRANFEPTGEDKLTPPPPIEKIKLAHKTLTVIADEEIALAERVVELLSRKRSRLDYDLGRVLALRGEPDPAAAVADAAPFISAGPGRDPAGSRRMLAGRNPVVHINERTARSSAAVGSRASGAEERAHKKRKTTAMQGSIKPPFPASAPHVPASGHGRRKRKKGSSKGDKMNPNFGGGTQVAKEGEGNRWRGKKATTRSRDVSARNPVIPTNGSNSRA